MFKHATMNRAYRLIWCEVRSTWVAVAEFARAWKAVRGWDRIVGGPCGGDGR